MFREALLATVILAALVALAGLVVRGRVSQCWSFAAYLCSVVTCGLYYIQPRYYTADFYMARQLIFDVLKTAVALEMAWLVVRAFPGALRTARFFALLLLGGSAVVLAAALPGSTSYRSMVSEWQPRVVACTALLFTLTALLVAWYHLPIRRLHRAVMGGFTVYLAFFATLLGMIARSWHAPDTRWWLGRIDPFAYLGLVLYWARVAWIPGEEAMPALEVGEAEPAAAPGLAEGAA